MALTKGLGGGAGSGTLTTIKDEGTTLTTAAASLDVVGAALTATNVGSAVTLTSTASEVLLSETVIAVTTASVTLSSFPATFRDLRLVVRGRGDTAATNTNVQVRFNGDTGANYDNEVSAAFGTSAFGFAAVAATSASVGWLAAATAPANVGSVMETRIGDYRGTTFQKSAVGVSNLKQGNASGSLLSGVHSAWWRSTSAITSILVFPLAGNFAAGTIVSLYGIM